MRPKRRNNPQLCVFVSHAYYLSNFFCISRVCCSPRQPGGEGASGPPSRDQLIEPLIVEKLKALLAALLRKTPPSTGEARAGGGDLSSQDSELGGEAKGTHTHQKRHKSKYQP